MRCTGELLKCDEVIDTPGQKSNVTELHGAQFKNSFRMLTHVQEGTLFRVSHSNKTRKQKTKQTKQNKKKKNQQFMCTWWGQGGEHFFRATNKQIADLHDEKKNNTSTQMKK